MLNRSSSPRLRGAAFTLVLAVISHPTGGQAQTAADTVLQVARRDGRIAATQEAVRGHFAGAFVSGLSLGIFGPFVLVDPELSPGGVIVAGLGAAGVAGIVSSARHAEGAAAEPLADRDRPEPEYDREYRAAFSERLRARRRRAVLFGAAAGTASGVAISAGVLSLILRT